jgi:hypothetical protein
VPNPWSNQQVSLVIITAPPNQFAGIFVYAPTPGTGNLIGSWAAQAGTDPFGNAYPQGLNVKAGSISGTTFNGTDFILNSNGMFFYNGTPALNNMILSIAQFNGTDALGNAYLSGFTSYTSGPTNDTAISIPANSNVIQWYKTTTGQAGPWTSVGQMGFPASNPAIIQTGVLFELLGVNASGINPVGGTIIYSSAVNSVNAMHEIMPSGNDRILDQSVTDQSQHANSGSASFLAVTALYTVTTSNASDSVAATVYEIETWGNGTWGTTAETLTFGLSINGATPIDQVTIGAALFAINTTFAWRVKYIVQVETTGVSGTVHVQCAGGIGATNANRLSSNTCSIDGHADAQAYNTTVQNTFQIKAAWGAAIASELITSFGSRFTRRGQ